MPRKSLTGNGLSPRVNFRVDEEVNEILQKVEVSRSSFIRRAIVYYWEHKRER